MGEMFKDCFAYHAKRIAPQIVFEECKALETRECKDKGACRFYKRKDGTTYTYGEGEE